MRPFLKLLDRRSSIAVTLLTLALIGVAGGAARFMMPAFPTVILYLLPVAVGAWYGGRAVGLALVVVSAAVWYLTDWLAKEQGVVVLWSGLTHFLLYAVIVLLIAAFRGYYREEKNVPPWIHSPASGPAAPCLRHPSRSSAVLNATATPSR